MTGWRVFASWQGTPDRTHGSWAGPETCREHPSWPAARRDALRTAALRGARYVTVQDPDDVVVGDYDRYTNYWRQYPRALVAVDHTTEVTDEDGRFAAAWCTCGWSRFAFHGPHRDSADDAAERVRGLARDHEKDPGTR